MALLANTDGKIEARAPLQGEAPEDLLSILGPQQPLTTLGANAGVLEMPLADGTNSIVTVRDVPDTDAQLTLIQPVDAALAVWRWDTRIEVTLLAGSCLLLLLLGGAVFYLGEPEARRGKPGRFRRRAARGAARLRRLALEFGPRPRALVGADVSPARPRARGRCYELPRHRDASASF